MPESKNTNDTTDEAVEPATSAEQTTDEVVEEKDIDLTEGADTSGASDPSVTPDENPPVEGELVDVPDELKDVDEDEDTQDTDDTDDTEEATTVAAATQTKDKRAGKKDVVTGAKKTVKPPRAKKADKKAKSGPPPRKMPKQRRWVAPLMLACWLIGLAWLVVFYVAGNDIPYMKDLNNWNLLIGMGLIALGFVVSTQWV